MPVQLGVNVQVGANAKAGEFRAQVSDALNKAGADHARQTLLNLSHYIGGPDRVRQGSIRIVNTTNNNGLDFRYKSFGWGQQYRKERTAEALVALLATAGVRNAQSLVDQMVRAQGADGKVQARHLARLFQNEDVRAALHHSPSDRGSGDQQLLPPPGPQSSGALLQQPVKAGNSAPRLESQPPVGQNPAPKAVIEPQPQPPVQVANQKQDQAVAQQPIQRSPEELRRAAATKFISARSKLLTSQDVFGVGCIRNLVNPGFFEATLQNTGQRAHYRDFSKYPIHLAPGAQVMDLDYAEFNRDYPGAPDEFRPPNYALVRNPQAPGDQALDFHCVDLSALPENLRNSPLEIWGTITETGVLDNMAHVKAQAMAAAVAKNMGGVPAKAASGLAPQQRANSDLTREVVQSLEGQLGLINDGQKVGEGGFGAVFPAQFEGKAVMLKLLIDPRHRDRVKPEKMDGERAGPDDCKLSEAYAVYLDKAKDSKWQKPNVLTPTHYVVRHDEPAGPRYEAIAAADIKRRARDRQLAPDGLKCVGIVMPRAPGTNLADKLSQGALTDAEFRQLARSGLNTARALNTRGWVHRDLKPVNMNLDAQGAHVFDTGLGYKFKKTPAQRAEANGLPNRQGRRAVLPPLFRAGQPGTPGYLHPAAVARGIAIGTQIDLHAWSMIFMQSRFPALAPGINIAEHDDAHRGAISYGELDAALDKVIRNGGPAAAQAQQFKAERLQPGTASHFISECLRLADQVSPLEWADRANSDKHLADLLSHPAIQ